MNIQSINPATEELLAEFDGMSFDHAVDHAKLCKKVQAEWATEPIAKRTTFVKNLATELRKAGDECAKMMTLEMGKPITQAKAEVEKCAVLCEYYAEHAAAFLAEDVIKTEAKKSYVRFDPLGVVLCIMPWNYPFWQVFRFAVPAMAAGNGVLLKHASNVPQCALKIEEIFVAAGFPQGLFKTLLIDSKTAGMLIENDAVAAVSLTGSTQAGAQVASHAGQNLKKCVLELGGSDPFIVFRDADVALAAKTAVQARMINNGQSCISAKRFIVEKKIAKEFEEEVVKQFKTLVVGNPIDAKVNIGPLAKLEFRDAIERQVNDAVSKGARVVCGGKAVPGKGAFFEPTLLADLKEDMFVYCEEVFGPVMSLIVVNDEKEALEVANSSEFGLGASVWMGDFKRAEEFAKYLEVGFVAINGMVKSDPRLPFGGVKKSGFGRELGSYGIKEFVNVKTIVVN